MPFLVPPMRMTVGPAMRRNSAAQRENTEDDKPFVAVRAALHPLSALADGDKKVIDFGLGYGVEGKQDSNDNDLHGPYLEVGAYPLRAELSNTVAIRAGANAAVEALYRRGSSDGHFGTTLGPLVEITQNVSGPFASEGEDGGAAVGAASGYWAFGLYGNASFRQLEAGLESSYSLGLSIRLPLAFGILCCAIPTAETVSAVSHGSSSHHGDHHKHHREPSRRHDDKPRPERIPAKPRPDK